MKKGKSQLIEKAGGIITRKNGDHIEVYVVHRPRYDDWSVPKGHIDEGEEPVTAALREVAEEAGFHCTVDKRLPPYFYRLPTGEESVIYFFEMTLVEEGLETDGEVDYGEWVMLSALRSRISYGTMADYIQENLSIQSFADNKS